MKSAPRGRRAAPRSAPERGVTRRGTWLLALVGVVVTAAALVGAGLAEPPSGTGSPAERTARLARTTVCPGFLPGSRAIAGAPAGVVRVGSEAAGKKAAKIDGPTTVTMDRDAAPGSFAGVFAQAPDWLAAGPCADPEAGWWFVGAGASNIHHGVLRLTNPMPGDAVVDITVFGPDGQVKAPGLNGVTVPAGASKRLPLRDVAPAVGDLAVHVVGSRGLVSASLDEEWASDFTAKKKASEWVPGQPETAKSLVFAGLADKPDSAQVLIANPGDQQADIEMSFIDTNGSFRPTKHATFAVPPETVLSTDLGDLVGQKTWPQAISLTSDQPISGTVRTVRGADEMLATALNPADKLAVAGVPGGVKAWLRVVAPDAGGNVSATFRGADGQPMGTRDFEVKKESAITVDVPQDARSVTLTGAGSRRGALLLEAGDKRIATVPLTSVLAETRVPQVRPGW